MRDDLLTLSQRVEEAAGPSRELDAEIGVAVLGMERDGGVFYAHGETFVLERDYYSIEGSARELPYYTASIDAAMSLVPEGMKLILDTHHMIATIYDYWPISAPEDDGFTSYQAEAATPVLALASAALRARSSQEK